MGHTWKKATCEQNKSKKAATVQSAALLCSVSIQLSAVMIPEFSVLNSVNHTLISSWLRWSMSALSCVSKITRCWLTLGAWGWVTTLDLLLRVFCCGWIWSSQTLGFLVEKLKCPLNELMFLSVFSLSLRLNLFAYIPKYLRQCKMANKIKMIIAWFAGRNLLCISWGRLKCTYIYRLFFYSFVYFQKITACSTTIKQL